ncbi:MAG TPA: flagellar biosynthetic protein FliO [Lachnospiraceae bacterium]|nr:flagellar biosynthetic protein FliO [Lachnospiraceae bacterium]
MLLSGIDAIFEFITVLFIFLVVCVITYFTTRFIAGYQKGKMNGSNIQSIEVYKVATNKYIQIIKVGEKNLVIAICKDTITLLTELSDDQIVIPELPEMSTINFRDILEKAKNLKLKK